MDHCTSGLEDQASKQGGLWIVLSFTEDGDLSISVGPGERNLHRSHLHHFQDTCECLTKAAFLSHQTALLQNNNFAASMQTEPRWDLNRCILLLMKGSLDGARGSQVHHGRALKLLWISAENWGCKRVVLPYRKMSGPPRVRFSLLDILIQCIRGFF